LNMGGEWDSGGWTLVVLSTPCSEWCQQFNNKQRNPVKLNKYFQQQTSFKYYPVPQPSLRDEVIVVKLYRGGVHTVHTYPFATLGPIVTHVRPHFVVENTYESTQR